ncbi:hypothetical protein BDZ89DRAFT_1130923 [Hymenopellis radicata]|nr:hypothetical protein BDZ89DRAFT_1130923 [Hymenopellis radicata]
MSSLFVVHSTTILRSFFSSLVVVETISKSVRSQPTVRLRRPRKSYRLQSRLAVLHESSEEESAARTEQVDASDITPTLNASCDRRTDSDDSIDREVTVSQTSSASNATQQGQSTCRSLTRRRWQSGYRSKCLAPPLERELGSRVDYAWMCSPQGKRVADLADDETLSSSRKRARLCGVEVETSVSKSRSAAAKAKSKSFSARAKEQRLEAAKAATLARRSWAFSASAASILGIKAASNIDAGEKFDLISTFKPVPLPVITSGPRQPLVVKCSRNDADESSGTEGGDELSSREGSVVGRCRLGASYPGTR